MPWFIPANRDKLHIIYRHAFLDIYTAHRALFALFTAGADYMSKMVSTAGLLLIARCIIFVYRS